MPTSTQLSSPSLVEITESVLPILRDTERGAASTTAALRQIAYAIRSLVPEENWRTLMAGWAEQHELHIAYCDDCGAVMLERHANNVYEGHSLVCHTCYTRWYGSGARVTHRNDDGEEMPEDILDWNSDPLGYHTGFLQTNAESARNMSDFDKEAIMYLGLEVEVERGPNADEDVHRQVNRAMSNFVITKSDGSLDNGFEIVTVPATYAYHKGGADGKSSPWEGFFAGPAKQLRAWSTDTCGLHIHVSRMALKPLQLAKIAAFIYRDENHEFIKDIAGRGHTNYARHNEDAPKKPVDILRASTEKYVALNIGRSTTIEFRLFRGNVRRSGLMRSIEFVVSLCQFANETSLTKIDATDFAGWMQSDYARSQFPYLQTWMLQKGYIEIEGKNQIRDRFKSKVIPLTTSNSLRVAAV